MPYNGSRALTTDGHVVFPAVLTSTKRYRVCAALVSNTPLWVGAVKNEELVGFWRCKVSRIGLMYSDSNVRALVNAPCSCPTCKVPL